MRVLFSIFTTLFALVFTTAAVADDRTNTYVLDIEAQALPGALKSFAEQTDLQVVFFAAVAEGKEAPALYGEFTADAALGQLLTNTELGYRSVDDRTYSIAPNSDTAEQGGDRDSGNASLTPALMTRNLTQTRAQQARKVPNQERNEDEPRRIEEIVVTGTNIRGIAPESSPVLVFDREDILKTGVSTLEDFIQTLPVNFGGGSNPDLGTGVPGEFNFNSAQNNSALGGAGSSINLRGLGSGGTLVLMNGNRIAPASAIGDFVDISMIPASAIERVEILTDGASSIYGADAVAGVVNFILRDDFDGAEASLRYGTATEGDLDEYRASVTAGRAWTGGNALFVYEYFRRTNLSAADRSFSEDAVLPNDLLPAQERNSVILSARHDLNRDLKVFADALYSKRVAGDDTTGFGRTFRNEPETENYNVSAGAEWVLSESWVADFAGTYSSLGTEGQISGDTTSQGVSSDSTIWSAEVLLSGDLFSVPGGVVKLAFGGQARREDFLHTVRGDQNLNRDADRDVNAVFAEAQLPIVGDDNAFPGVRRLDFNLSARYEDFSDFGSELTPKVGALWSPADGVRVRGSFSESFIAPPLGIVGGPQTASSLRTSFINQVVGLTPADPSIEDVVVITTSGTGVEPIGPERSRAYSIGADLERQWRRSGLIVSLTWFDIEFEDRVGPTPIPDSRNRFDAVNIAFDNPELFPPGAVIFSPTPEQIDAVISNADRLDIIGDADPANAQIINQTGILRNLAFTKVSGLDANIGFNIDTDAGNFDLGLDASYFFEYEQRAAFSVPAIDRLNTLYNPVDLRLRGTVAYTRGGLAANLAVYYTDSYSVDGSGEAAEIDAWTTADLILSYDTGDRRGNALLNDLVVRLSVLNLFDEDPPATPSRPQGGLFGYDPTNASALNRFVALELTKRF